jgi:hypothetical protein
MTILALVLAAPIMVDIQLTVVEAGISMRTYMGSQMESRRPGDQLPASRMTRTTPKSPN